MFETHSLIASPSADTPSVQCMTAGFEATLASCIAGKQRQETKKYGSAMTRNDMLHATPATTYARKHHLAVLPVQLQRLSVLLYPCTLTCEQSLWTTEGWSLGWGPRPPQHPPYSCLAGRPNQSLSGGACESCCSC